MGSKSSTSSNPTNQQLSSGAASNISTGKGSAVTVSNVMHDAGAVQGGLNLGQSAVSMAGSAATGAMLANSAIANNAMTAATIQSAASLQAMQETVDASNKAKARTESLAAMQTMHANSNLSESAKLAMEAANDSAVMIRDIAFSNNENNLSALNLNANLANTFISQAAQLTNNISKQSQDQLTGVLGAVSGNSLAMVSSSAVEAKATEDMTNKLLLGAGLVAAVMIFKGA